MCRFDEAKELDFFSRNGKIFPSPVVVCESVEVAVVVLVEADCVVVVVEI